MTRNGPRAAAFFAVSCVVCACQGTGFGVDGYHSPLYPFSIAYTAPREHAFASKDWLIDNFVLDEDGAPLRRKSGDNYRRTLILEGQNGEKLSPTLDIYDPLLLHERSNAAIWVRSIPRTGEAIARPKPGAISDGVTLSPPQSGATLV